MRDSQAKLILFTQLQRGPLTGPEAKLFPVRMRDELRREGVIKLLPDGGIELAHATGYSRVAPSDRPPAPNGSHPPPSQSGTMPALMPTVTARVPQAVIDALDELRAALNLESRGAAIRHVLGEWAATAPRHVRKAGGR